MSTREEARRHADEWEALAEGEDVKDGQAARHRAATYRRTAQALRLEAKTGLPHCACCLKICGPAGNTDHPPAVSPNKRKPTPKATPYREPGQRFVRGD